MIQMTSVKEDYEIVGLYSIRHCVLTDGMRVCSCPNGPYGTLIRFANGQGIWWADYERDSYRSLSNEI